jgi:hypothetical protein
MTEVTVTVPEEEDGSFYVSDAMYGEVQEATAKSLATQAVF